MLSAITQFRVNLKQVRELGDLAVAIKGVTTPVIDVSDIYRAQLVLAVSALDHFIHELVRLGMIDSAKGGRPKTDAYLKFKLPVTAMHDALSGASIEALMSDAIRKEHSWQSFQKPEKIATAVKLITNKKLWDDVSTILVSKKEDICSQLEIIVDRRNKIAHEADMDPTNPGFRWPITQILANNAVDFIDSLAEAIFSVV